MVKKRPTKLPKNSAPEAEPEGTVPFQVRFDADLHARLKREAEKADISLNQLIQGICRGVLDYLHQGEAEETKAGFVVSRPQKRCLFIGRPGISEYEPDEAMEYRLVYREDPPPPDDGILLFSLDFTNRGVVRNQRR